MCEKTPVHNIADHQWQLPRREVLMGLLGSLGAATSLSSMRGAAAPSESDGERFWHLVKSQFPLRAGLSLMNAANLCPSPYKVLESVFSLTRDLDADASFQNREKFSRLVEASRRALADYLGASPDEIVIPRNTSEANNIVIGGLDLGEGDDDVLWDQNHPANNVAWDVRARRFGFSVRRVTTPTRAVPQGAHQEDQGPVFQPRLEHLRPEIAGQAALRVGPPAGHHDAHRRRANLWFGTGGRARFGLRLLHG